MNPPGGRRQVPLNQDFFVGFGRTVLKPEEVVVSVFIPFSRKVKMDFSCAADGDDGALENQKCSDRLRRASSVPWRCADLSLPVGGAGSSLPTRSEEGELFRYRDDWDESVLLGGIQGGSGRQHLLRRNGSDHC